MPLRVAPFAFVLLWSSSFIAARVGLRHLTPLLFVAVRMVLAAAVLLGVMTMLRRSWRGLAGCGRTVRCRRADQQRAADDGARRDGPCRRGADRAGQCPELTIFFSH